MSDHVQRLLDDIRLDDAWLDGLGSALPLAAADNRLGLCLLAWRIKADASPVPELVDTDTACAVIAAAKRPRYDGVRTAAAAALVVLALVGLGILLMPVLGGLWWAVPAIGASGLAGALCAVIRMRPDAEWTTREIDGQRQGSGS